MDMRDLYQELILDHGKHPRNYRAPEHANLHAEGKNPLCGDHVRVHVQFEDGIVKDIGFEGTGCAISTAAASTMTEAVKGLDRAGIQALFETFHALVTGESEAEPETLGKLAAFAGLSEYPMRVKCATLAWHTLQAALNEQASSITTE